LIRLEVEEYCGACLEFVPDVLKPQRTMLTDGKFIFTDTIVTCEHRKRCNNIKRYLEQQARGDDDV
jgi:hypothetical protein